MKAKSRLRLKILRTRPISLDDTMFKLQECTHKRPKAKPSEDSTKLSWNHDCSKQLGLFTASKPDLIVDRVPQNIALGDDRYYIHCDDWFAGVQLARDEAYRAIGLIGRKRNPEAIYSAIERVLDGGEA